MYLHGHAFSAVFDSDRLKKSNKKAQLADSLANQRDAVDIRVMAHGSLKGIEVTPFDSLHAVSYYRPIITLCPFLL